MNGNGARVFRLGAGLASLVVLGWVLSGQAARPVKRGISLPTDWTHRHLVFSHPRTAALADRVVRDPRYLQQQHRQADQLVLPVRMNALADRVNTVVPAERKKKPFRRDWSENIGAGATGGIGVYPAKFSFDTTTANCGDAETPDFVAFGTGLAGDVAQPSIVAFDNLYSGCTPVPVPDVYWSYNTGGTILTSPVLSLDGTQLAFMQSVSGAASLVVLKWAPATGTLTTPVIPTPAVPELYSACTAPCMTQVAMVDGLSVPLDDTTSSVYYDYSNDVAWVGGANGWLHKFTGVFHGTPAEVLTGGFPVQVDPSAPTLSSPVYDRITNNVFVADSNGFLDRVDASTAIVVQSGQMDVSVQTVLPVPIVDSAAGSVFYFSSDDNVAGCGGLSGADCTGVFQLSTSFVAGDTGNESVVGASSFAGDPTPNPFFAGAFDSIYLNSNNATGNLYVCGNTGGSPTVFQVPISLGVIAASGVAVDVLAASGNTPVCSTVTAISAPGASIGLPPAERFFVSVQDLGNTNGCSGGGCISNFIITPWQASTTYSVGQQILVKGSNPTRRLIATVTVGGVSGISQPGWSGPFGTFGNTANDGGVTWIDQGNPALVLHARLNSHAYTLNTTMLDGNGNVEIVRTAGTSAASAPTFSATPGQITIDGSVHWVNAGKLPTVGLQLTGGASAIIVDNTVDPGTLLGASQVYFTTLADQALCGTPPASGGCAIQVSQSGLN